MKVRWLPLLFVSLICALAGAEASPAAPTGGATPNSSFEGTIAYRYDYGNVESEGEAIYALDGSGNREIWSRFYDGGPGYTGNINWSRRGELAFRVNESIFAVGEGGGTAREIVAGAEDEGYTHPTWSPAGDRLAVVQKGSIHVISASDGSGMPGPLTQGGEPAWSPDGERILFTGGGASLSTIDPDGGSVEPVPSLQLAASRPSWSPDSQNIAFTSGHDLFVIGADGEDLRNITNTPTVQEWDPEWSPDGEEIAFLAQETSGSGFSVINIINVETGATRLVHDPGGVGRAHAISWLAPRVIDNVEFTQAIQQLQTLTELQSDIAGDGKPPVPLVGGKPMVVRVYPSAVQQATTYTFELSGQYQRSEQVTLQPGCTTEKRRKQESNCDSVNFYFTPPAGSWSVTLKVRDPVTVLEEHEFSLTSVDTAGLAIRYTPVCVGTPPVCPTNAVDTADGLIRKLYPAAEDEVSYGALPVPAMHYPGGIASDASLLADLRLRYELMLMGGFAFDQLAGWLPQGGASSGTLGIADPVWFGSTGRVSWQQDTSATDPLDHAFTLAHEIGHNLSLRHTNKADGCGAADGSTDWPGSYSDSTIQEVGFDVLERKAVLDSQKDVMTYCSPPGTNIWISPFSYNKILTGNFAPQSVSVQSAGEPMQFLVVKGTALADGSAASIDSSYVITSTTPAGPSNPLGNYCLRTTGGAQLDNCFLLRFQDHRTGEPLDSESFALRVVLPPGTTHVSLARGLQELDALGLSETAPSLSINDPTGELSGEETISWIGADLDGDPLNYAVMYSHDNGVTWLPIAVDVTESQFTFDTGVLEGEEVLVRVLASDGLQTTTDTTNPISLVRGLPHVWGDNDCDGEISSRDNQALSRLVLAQPALSQTQPCPALGDLVTVGGDSLGWGDLDCDSEITSRDGQALLRKVLAQNPLSQTQPCPVIAGLVTVVQAAGLLAGRLAW